MPWLCPELGELGVIFQLATLDEDLLAVWLYACEGVELVFEGLSGGGRVKLDFMLFALVLYKYFGSRCELAVNLFCGGEEFYLEYSASWIYFTDSAKVWREGGGKGYLEEVMSTSGAVGKQSAKTFLQPFLRSPSSGVSVYTVVFLKEPRKPVFGGWIV